jgi:hypothetical protein
MAQMRNSFETLVGAAHACGLVVAGFASETGAGLCLTDKHLTIWNPEDNKEHSHDLMVKLRLNVKFGRFGICVKQTGTTHRLEDNLRAKEYEDYGYQGMDAGQLMCHLLVRAAATMPQQVKPPQP